MSPANGIPRGKDETIELQKILDDPSTEWVSWKEAEDELRELDKQESLEKAEANPPAPREGALRRPSGP